jgi:hypothetical protein
MRWAVLALSLILVWRVIQVNAVLYDDSGRPRLAAAPPASDLPPGERKAFESAALRRILSENPGEVAALLMLARDYEAEGDAARATRAYRSALELAPLDRDVLGFAAAHLLRQEDDGGVELLARLAAHYPGARSQVFPVLAEVVASGRHRAAVAAMVSRNPGWLGAFLVEACNRGVEPAVLMPALARKSASAGGATPEARCVIDRLRDAGRWEEAYQVWLNLLPRERLANVGYVYNGSFEFPPSGVGFDWIAQARPEKEAGHVAEIQRAQGAAGAWALRVVGRRQSGFPVQQFLALVPGRYELSGLARPESIKALKGIHWTVRCVERGRPQRVVASSERFLGSSEWRRFAMEIVVDADCQGQALQLEPVVEDGAVAFVSGSAWFDDLTVLRQEVPVASRPGRQLP